MSKPKKGVTTEIARAPSTAPGGSRFKTTGTLIIKSVSIFIASGRRASHNRLENEAKLELADKKRRRAKKILIVWKMPRVKLILNYWKCIKRKLIFQSNF